MINKLLGQWRMLPHLCKYQTGIPPIFALYTFTQKDYTVKVQIKWRDVANQQMNIEYDMLLDGQKRKQVHSGREMTVKHKISKNMVISTTYNDKDEVLMESFRKISQDGLTMEVEMLSYAGEEKKQILQTYQKVTEVI